MQIGLLQSDGHNQSCDENEIRVLKGEKYFLYYEKYKNPLTFRYCSLTFLVVMTPRIGKRAIGKSAVTGRGAEKMVYALNMKIIKLKKYLPTSVTQYTATKIMT